MMLKAVQLIGGATRSQTMGSGGVTVLVHGLYETAEPKGREEVLLNNDVVRSGSLVRKWNLKVKEYRVGEDDAEYMRVIQEVSKKYCAMESDGTRYKVYVRRIDTRFREEFGTKHLRIELEEIP